MKVNETIVAMMKSWPSMYSTRKDALRNMFSSSNYHWVNGELVPSCEGVLYPSRLLSEVLDDEDKAVAKIDALKSKNAAEWEITSAIGDLLHIRRQNNECRFVWENAELLAVENTSKFRANPSLNKDTFNLPADVTSEWFDAAKDLAISILVHKFITHPEYIESYDKREMAEFERAKVLAQEFLDRYNPEKVMERNEKLEQVRKEAKALGYELVKAE